MPTEANSTALTPIDGEYLISVKDFDGAGRKTEMSIRVPDNSDFDSWSLQQQIVMLKRGPWAALSIPDILWGVTYAKRIGADPIKGDIFPTGSGRWGTSNKYKIRQALATGNIIGIETDFKQLDNVVPSTTMKDIECTVTITVKGWAKPIVRKARLSRWFKATNPNWVGNPEHMLELNTVAHACEYVAPGATEDDEAPPPIAIVEAKAV